MTLKKDGTDNVVLATSATGEQRNNPGSVPEMLQGVAEHLGGTMGPITPFGATMSIPLRKSHWIYGELEDEPEPLVPAGNKVYIGVQNSGRSSMVAEITRRELAAKIRECGRWAIKGATASGTIMDFDPDALLQNLVAAMLGPGFGCAGPLGERPENPDAQTSGGVANPK